MPALTLTNLNFLTARRTITKSRAFPEIYQRKFSCVNDVSMMIDISIATVYPGGILLFLSFFNLFSVFSFVYNKKIIPYFFVLVLIKYVS